MPWILPAPLSQYVHDRWGADKGFIGGGIYAISQSADGYLWIGTERGLVRFDGFHFMLIQGPLPDAPPTGPIRGLVSDADGNLWIRPEGPRMLVYHDGKFEDADPRFDLQVLTFTSSAPDNDGGVILSGLGDRTFRYRKGQLETILPADQNPGTVISQTATRDGKVWLGTQDNGLFRLRGELPGSLRRCRIGRLTHSCRQRMEAFGSEPTTESDSGMAESLRLPTCHHRLTSFRFWPWQWIMTQISGWERTRVSCALHRQVLFLSISSARKPGNEVTAIFEDRDGDLWFGGSRGIERLRDGMFTTYSTPQGFPSDKIGAIYVGS